MLITLLTNNYKTKLTKPLKKYANYLCTNTGSAAFYKLQANNVEIVAFESYKKVSQAAVILK